MREVILLVIGSVTAKQYEPIRLFHINNGSKPKIVRLSYEAMQRIVDFLKESQYTEDDFERKSFEDDVSLSKKNLEMLRKLVKRETGAHLSWDQYDVIYDGPSWNLCTKVYRGEEFDSVFYSTCEEEYVITDDNGIQVLDPSIDEAFKLVSW